MDKKLPETTYLCVEIMNSKRQKGETLVTWYKLALFSALDNHWILALYK